MHPYLTVAATHWCDAAPRTTVQSDLWLFRRRGFMPDQLLPFLAVVAVITATPGPDTALVVRNALQSGRGHGLLTALGCSMGLLTWGAASALGLATVFHTSTVLFTIIRMAGGVYLAWLGLRMMVDSWNEDGKVVAGRVPDTRQAPRQPFVQGLLTDLLNPKAAAFFTALLPQFVDSEDNVFATTLLFAAIAAAGALAGLSVYACVAARARTVLGRPGIRRLLDRATGAVLMALGLRMLARPAH